MDAFPWIDLAVLAGLILINGVFAMSELAIVSVRKPRMQMAASKGSRAAQVALDLAEDPGKFLSTVQIGITLVGIIAGAYSGATLGGPVAERLEWLGVPARYADNAGFALVIGLTTYFSLVVGELVPKQFALRAAEPIALVVALPMAWLAKAAAPIVWLLDNSSSALMRLLGIRQRGEHGMTLEELRMIFREATHTGVLEEQESALLSGVIRLTARPVRELMTPRTELDWIDIGESAEELRQTIAASPHSTLPVADGTPDKVLGIVKVRDVLGALLVAGTFDLATLLRKAEVVPDRLDAMDALRIMQQSGSGMALVHDEYGHFEGIVTSADLLSAIAGTFASHQDEGDQPLVVEREDGSLLVSGALGADTLSERLDLDLPEDREYATAAGYALFQLKHLPQEGEHFTDQGWRFEIVDMDGRRIDKLLVSKIDVASDD
jgi:putative hemolysin